MFFRKKRKKQLEDEIAKLQEQLRKLQKPSSDSASPVVHEYHFHIQQVTIKEPTLEQLTFQLDSIDIEEVSGALNVGNNFGVSVEDPDKKHQKRPYHVKESKQGFSVSFSDKEG